MSTAPESAVRVWRLVGLSCASAAGLAVLVRVLSGADAASLVSAYVGMMFDVESIEQLSGPTRGLAEMVVGITSPLIHYYPLVAVVNRALVLVLVATLVYMAMGFIDARLSWSAVAIAASLASLVHDTARAVMLCVAASVSPPSFEEVLSGEFGRAPLGAFFGGSQESWLMALADAVDFAAIAFVVTLVAILSERVEPRVRQGAIGAVISVLYVSYVLGRSAVRLAGA